MKKLRTTGTYLTLLCLFVALGSTFRIPAASAEVKDIPHFIANELEAIDTNAVIKMTLVNTTPGYDHAIAQEMLKDISGAVECISWDAEETKAFLGGLVYHKGGETGFIGWSDGYYDGFLYIRNDAGEVETKSIQLSRYYNLFRFTGETGFYRYDNDKYRYPSFYHTPNLDHFVKTYLIAIDYSTDGSEHYDYYNNAFTSPVELPTQGTANDVEHFSLWLGSGRQFKLFEQRSEPGFDALQLYQTRQGLMNNDAELLYCREDAQILELLFDNKLILRWDLENNVLDSLCEWRNEIPAYKIRQRHQIHPSMPEYLFTVHARDVRFRGGWYEPDYYDGGYTYDKIVITNPDNGKVVQIITPYRESAFWPPFIGGIHRFDGTFRLTLADMNFDGYDDLSILRESLGNKENPYYYCFLWNPETQTFVEEQQLGELPDIQIDPETRTISSRYFATGHHCEKEYRYLDGVLTPVREFTTDTLYSPDADGNDGVTYEKRLIDGEMVTVYEEYFRWVG